VADQDGSTHTDPGSCTTAITAHTQAGRQAATDQERLCRSVHGVVDEGHAVLGDVELGQELKQVDTCSQQMISGRDMSRLPVDNVMVLAESMLLSKQVSRRAGGVPSGAADPCDHSTSGCTPFVPTASAGRPPHNP
jgi:hypothetical protein